MNGLSREESEKEKWDGESRRGACVIGCHGYAGLTLSRSNNINNGLFTRSSFDYDHQRIQFVFLFKSF